MGGLWLELSFKKAKHTILVKRSTLRLMLKCVCVCADIHRFMFACVRECMIFPWEMKYMESGNWTKSRKFPQCVSRFVTLVSCWADHSRAVPLHCAYFSSRQAESDEKVSSETHHHALTRMNALFSLPRNKSTKSAQKCSSNTVHDW